MTAGTSSPGLRLEEVRVGSRVPSLQMPLTAYRMVMWAGAGRDFNSIHHNTAWAQATGAPEMYANTGFLLGIWERAIREWAGPSAFIAGIRNFRMRRFNLVGSTLVVTGSVIAVDEDEALVTVELRTSDPAGITVGPGEVLVRLPRGDESGALSPRPAGGTR